MIVQTEQLKTYIRASAKKRCMKSADDLIFGRVDQARHILMETFEGTHVLLDGPDGNTIDCMFFPCTSKETVKIDNSVPLDGKTKTPPP